MNHIHRICRFLASLTRPAGILVARRAAVPAAAATTRSEPPRWTTHPPVPAPNRAIATSEPRVGVRPQPPRERLRTRAVPARLPHTIQGVHPLPGEPGRVLGQPHGRQDGTQALVPILLRGTGPGPLRHDPVRELARCHAGHDAQVPALRHADPGSPAEKAGVRADPPIYAGPGRDRRRCPRPMPGGTVNVVGCEYPPSPPTTFLHA